MSLEALVSKDWYDALVEEARFLSDEYVRSRLPSLRENDFDILKRLQIRPHAWVPYTRDGHVLNVKMMEDLVSRAPTDVLALWAIAQVRAYARSWQGLQAEIELLKSKMMVCGVMYIYALCDISEPEHIRYVGATRDLTSRMTGHMADRHHGSSKGNWVKSVVDSGGQIGMMLVERVDVRIGEHAEKYWINWFLQNGHELTNSMVSSARFAYEPIFDFEPSSTQMVHVWPLRD